MLERHEYDTVTDDLGWLNMHLKSPPVLHEAGTERAICWFTPEASKPIARVRSIARLLNEHGHRVRQIITDRPGTIIYRDGWQIVAYPFRDQRRRWR